MIPVNRLYETLSATSLLINDSSNHFFQQFHLGITRYYALLYIQQLPGISLSDLSQKLLCTKGNTTRIIRSLEEDGLLEREADARDNRAFQLRLTSTGHSLVEQVTQAYQVFNQKRFACLEDREQELLQRHLDRLNQHLETMRGTLIVDM
jgi:DNA-binding MarR family transcriptional regulator